MAKDQVESLIGQGEWEEAVKAIEEELRLDPDDHWLWSRLSTVKYEQRKYQEALDAANKALAIVPDCPLALWSLAGALDALGKTAEALKVYAALLGRGIEELLEPDEDANECWEGPAWTYGLVTDCIFRGGGCLAEIGQKEKAVRFYELFLELFDSRKRGIYSPEDAVERLKKLRKRSKKALSARMDEARRELEDVLK
jgi:tetratricopeptide (TPR) repeat protein